MQFHGTTFPVNVLIIQCSKKDFIPRKFLKYTKISILFVVIKFTFKRTSTLLLFFL